MPARTIKWNSVFRKIKLIKGGAKKISEKIDPNEKDISLKGAISSISLGFNSQASG